MTDAPPSPVWTPPTDEELDSEATVTIFDIAEAMADLIGRLPEVADEVGARGPARRPDPDR
jgi:hypothetical protein